MHNELQASPDLNFPKEGIDNHVGVATYLTVDIVNGQLLHLLEGDVTARQSWLHGALSINDCNLIPRIVCQIRPQPPQILACKQVASESAIGQDPDGGVMH